MPRFLYKLFLLLSVFSLFCITLSAYAETDPWYESNPSCVIERGNPARTGEYKSQPLSKLKGIAWSVEGERTFAGFSCYDSMLFASSASAMKIDNGASAGNYSEGIVSFSAPTIYKGIAYFSLNNSKNAIQAVNLSTKKEIFSIPANKYGNAYSSPIIYNDILYVSLANAVAAYDLKYQKRLWLFDISSKKNKHIQSGQISTDGERIYFDNHQDKIYALDMRTGKIVWILNGKISGGYISYYNNKIYFYNKKIYAADAKTGKIVWQKSFSGAEGGALAISDELVFSASRKTGIYVFDANTGQIKKHFPISATSSPIVAQNVLYFRNKYHMLYALDKFTGKILWKYDTELYAGYATEYDFLPYQGMIFANGGQQYMSKIIALR